MSDVLIRYRCITGRRKKSTRKMIAKQRIQYKTELTNGREKIIEMRIRALLVCDDAEELVKKYILQCVKHSDNDMQLALSNVIKTYFKQFESMVAKYLLLK